MGKAKIRKEKEREKELQKEQEKEQIKVAIPKILEKVMGQKTAPRRESRGTLPRTPSLRGKRLER